MQQLENVVLHDFPNRPCRDFVPRNTEQAVGKVRSALRYLYQEFSLFSMTRDEAMANTDARVILQNAYAEILKADRDWAPAFRGETIDSIMRTVSRRVK